jgi:hypothetical protein
MAKRKAGVRDGSGPYKGSYQDRNVGRGKRQVAGQPCPKKGGRR